MFRVEGVVDPAQPVYVISVAAQLVAVHPRTLRIYEEEGLICPSRTASNIRLFSENDLRRILWIRHLTRELGVNLAGVEEIMRLRHELDGAWKRQPVLVVDRLERRWFEAGGDGGQRQDLHLGGRRSDLDGARERPCVVVDRHVG